jgi:hypothetical protein
MPYSPRSRMAQERASFTLPASPLAIRLGAAHPGRMRDVRLVPISATEYPRPSPVPARAVLATDRARELGITPSDWRSATAVYTRELLSVAAG